jgi:ribosomal protein L24E
VCGVRCEMKGKVCLQCGDPILRTRGEFIAQRADGSEMWLCGRLKCAENYEDNKPPRQKRLPK